MSVTQILIAIVILLAIALVATLVVLTRFRRRGSAGDAAENRSLPDLLKQNADRGDIQSVARMVSDILINQCGCDRIIFLRRKRGMLTLNYYHGVTRFNRKDFNLRFSTSLHSILTRDFWPRPLENLRDQVPDKYFDRLVQHGIDQFFPVYWHDNFYGCYFVHAERDLSESAAGLTAATAAHSLAAAYHVKWHESRLAAAEKSHGKRPETKPAEAPVPPEESRAAKRFVSLLRYRSSAAVLPRVLHTVQEELALDKVAYFYQTGVDDEAPRIVSRGIENRHPRPTASALRTLTGIFDSGLPVGTDELDKQDNPELVSFSKELTACGLTHVVPFPLHRTGYGVIAFSGGKVSSSVTPRLQELRETAADLVDNAASYERLEEMSYTDDLTGLANQRYFYKRLDEEIRRASRYKRHLALIIFDLDDLKFINDRHGHLAGDAVLRQMGRLLRDCTRSIDVVARYGGDEFCVVMPEADQRTCTGFMERLRGIITESEFDIEQAPTALRCTISLGAAIYPEHADCARDLIHAADMALLKAKEGGRNGYLIHARETS